MFTSCEAKTPQEEKAKAEAKAKKESTASAKATSSNFTVFDDGIVDKRHNAWDKAALDAMPTAGKEPKGAVNKLVSSKGPLVVSKAEKPLADLFGNVPRGKRARSKSTTAANNKA